MFFIVSVFIYIMKNLIFTTILLFNFISGFTQKIIIPKWSTFFEDTTLVKSEFHANLNNIFQVSSENILLVSNTYSYGWTLKSIDKKSGKIAWSNSQNYNYPIKGNKNYYYCNSNLLTNNELEILGGRDVVKYPQSQVGGFGVRYVYDIKTGKLKRKFEEADTSKSKLSTYITVFYPFSLRSKNNTYIHWRLLPEFAEQKHYQPSIVDTFMRVVKKLDTISRGYKLEHNYYQNYGVTMKETKDNNLLVFSSSWGGLSDSTYYLHLMKKITKEGKTLFIKNYSKDFYYYLNRSEHTPTTDGFLISGHCDIDLGYFTKQKQNVKALLAKVTDDGVLQWKTIIEDIGTTFYRVITPCADEKRKGTWVLAGKSFKNPRKNTDLFFVNQKGESKKIATIELPNDAIRYQPGKIFSLASGDLVIALKNQLCDTVAVPPLYCDKYAFISSEQLDNLLSTNENIAVATKYTIFPNPNKGVFTVLLNTVKNGRIAIYTLSGQKVYQKDFFDTVNIVCDDTDLENGIYFVDIKTTEGESITDKIVVMK